MCLNEGMGWTDTHLLHTEEQTSLVGIQVGFVVAPDGQPSVLSLFRQKKVMELLEKNYKIHCSVHNKVTRTILFFFTCFTRSLDGGR